MEDFFDIGCDDEANFDSKCRRCAWMEAHVLSHFQGISFFYVPFFTWLVEYLINWM